MRLRMLVLMIVLLTAPGLVALPQQAAKPLTKDQIMTVVTAGMDNADLAKQIEARGIDFDLTDDYLQALRKAGAQEVVVRALRTVKPSPLGRDQLLLLVAGGVPSERAAALVKQRGVDFMPDDKYLESLRTVGADDALIAAVREAKPPEVQRHLAHAVECEQNRAWAEAEKEYRVLLALSPGNAELLQKAEIAAKHQKPPQFKLVKTITAHTGSYAPCGGGPSTISPDGRWLAWSYCDSLDVWEAASGEKKTSLPGRNTFAFSPDGHLLAAVTLDLKAVAVWDVATGREIASRPAANPLCIQFTPDGLRLALGGRDGTISLSELASGKEVWAVTARTDTQNRDGDSARSIYCIAFSPDGRLLASTGDQSAIKLWDTATGKEVGTLAGHKGMPDAFAFSPDGRWLASTSSRDNGVTLWEVATGQAARTFEEHGQYENPHYAGEIAFTPDGDWLVWSDLSGICTLWEVGTGRKVGKIEGWPGAGGSVGFSADGKWLAGEANTKLYLWQRQD